MPISVELYGFGEMFSSYLLPIGRLHPFHHGSFYNGEIGNSGKYQLVPGICCCCR